MDILKALVPPVPPMGLRLLSGNLIMSRLFCWRDAKPLQAVFMPPLPTGAIAQKVLWSSVLQGEDKLGCQQLCPLVALLITTYTAQERAKLLTHPKCRQPLMKTHSYHQAQLLRPAFREEVHLLS